MRTQRHTPGPWVSTKPSFFDPNSTRHVKCNRGFLVARINFANAIQSENEAIANAALIAEAPSILAAAEHVVDVWSRQPGNKKIVDMMDAIDSLRAAVAKAKP